MEQDIIIEGDKAKVAMTKEEAEKLYVPANNLKSRECTEADIPKILELAPKMQEMCRVGRGFYPAGFAIVHCQIDDKDPMAFFVTATGEVIVNPTIINQTQYKIDKIESCLSFPENQPIKVPRSHKITGMYKVIDTENKKFLPTLMCKLSGIEAQIYQHEIDHIEGRNIYGVEFN